MSRPAPGHDLQSIPGVGPSIARDLRDLGIRFVEDLRTQDPERLFLTLCMLRGTAVDRCVLYVFRCAVYYARHRKPDPDLLKWWNWKDSLVESRDALLKRARRS